jgi:hypothetical protein
MPTIIAYHPLGYEVHFEVEPGELDAMVRKLERHRFRASRELALHGRRAAHLSPARRTHGQTVQAGRRVVLAQGDRPGFGPGPLLPGLCRTQQSRFRGAAGSWAAGRSGRGQQPGSGQKRQQPAGWPRRHRQAEPGAVWLIIINREPGMAAAVPGSLQHCRPAMNGAARSSSNDHSRCDAGHRAGRWAK